MVPFKSCTTSAHSGPGAQHCEVTEHRPASGVHIFAAHLPASSQRRLLSQCRLAQQPSPTFEQVVGFWHLVPTQMSGESHFVPLVRQLFPSVPAVLPTAHTLLALQLAAESVHVLPGQHALPVAPQSAVQTFDVEHVKPVLHFLVGVFAQQGWPEPPHATHLLFESHSAPDVQVLPEQQALPTVQFDVGLSHLPLVQARPEQQSLDALQDEALPAQHLLAVQVRPTQQSLFFVHEVLGSAQHVLSVAHSRPALSHWPLLQQFCVAAPQLSEVSRMSALLFLLDGPGGPGTQPPTRPRTRIANRHDDHRLFIDRFITSIRSASVRETDSSGTDAAPVRAAAGSASSPRHRCARACGAPSCATAARLQGG